MHTTGAIEKNAHNILFFIQIMYKPAITIRMYSFGMVVVSCMCILKGVLAVIRAHIQYIYLSNLAFCFANWKTNQPSNEYSSPIQLS